MNWTFPLVFFSYSSVLGKYLFTHVLPASAPLCSKAYKRLLVQFLSIKVKLKSQFVFLVKHVTYFLNYSLFDSRSE